MEYTFVMIRPGATEEIKRFFNIDITNIKQASKQLKKEKL